MTESSPTVICVLGMHRSGTSFITRALSLCGVYLGPDDHAMKPREDNPQGFFEHQLLTNINDEILSTLGGTWHTPPALAPGWEADPRLDDIRTRARELLQKDFGSATLWGWKDPRACLTLPFWQQLLPSMKYVICVRSPLDVALSLHARDGFSVGKGASLWIEHVAGALMHTSGRRRLLVSYDDAIEHQDHELKRLAAFIGRPASSAESGAAVRAVTDSTLRHHRTQIVAVVNERRLPFHAKALYLSLLMLLDRQRRQPASESATADGYATAVDRLGDESRFAEADAHERRQIETEWRSRFAELEAAHRAAVDVHGLRLEVATRERERDEARALVASLHAQLAVLATAANRTAAEINGLRLDVTTHQRERDDAHKLVSSLRAELAESARRIAVDVDEVRRKLAIREREREDARAMARSIQQDLEASAERTQVVTRDRDRLRDLSLRLQDGLDEARRRTAYLQTLSGWFKTALRAVVPGRMFALERWLDPLVKDGARKEFDKQRS